MTRGRARQTLALRLQGLPQASAFPQADQRRRARAVVDGERIPYRMQCVHARQPDGPFAGAALGVGSCDRRRVMSAPRGRFGGRRTSRGMFCQFTTSSRQAGRPDSIAGVRSCSRHADWLGKRSPTARSAPARDRPARRAVVGRAALWAPGGTPPIRPTGCSALEATLAGCIDLGRSRASIWASRPGRARDVLRPVGLSA